MIEPIFYDTETCGFHGPPVLIQWAEGVDGEVHLHEVWREPIVDTLLLIEKMMTHQGGLCGFNLSFDHFHLCQVYTTLKLLGEKVGYAEFPDEHIEEYALLEPEARDGDYLKPVTALDLMLHARKGPYQSTMDRNDIRIRRVPAALAEALCRELDKRIPLKDIYFARFKDPTRRWRVYDIEDDLGDVDPDFKDVVLKFNPSSALKALAGDALGNEEEILKFEDVNVIKKMVPNEIGYAPFALAVGQPGNWGWAWPDVMWYHVRHWANNRKARKYAKLDVVYLQKLYEHFGRPEMGDDDSVLACMVGAVRWRGFRLNLESLQAQKDKALAIIDKCPFNVNSVKMVRRFLQEAMSDEQKAIIGNKTGKIVLEGLAKDKDDTVCLECEGLGTSDSGRDCAPCEGTGLIRGTEPSAVAKVAQLVLDVRKAHKRVQLFDKLLAAGRFHADFNVIGALSSRMSGASGLNAQGINKESEVRQCFTLAFDGEILLGGDFDGFEVCLMDAAYGDPKLREQLLSGKKIHALFGVFLFPELDYDGILATKGLPEGEDKYSRSKNGVFAMAYGGEAHTLVTRVGVSESVASEAYQRWIKSYKVWGERRQEIFDMFCSMRQPGGIGTNVEWHEPAPYVESMFGFRRYFTLENQIVSALFELANDPPKSWTRIKIKVTRRDRAQSVSGATRSALYGAAFQVQAANMRAAGNHVIQSSGATLCKELERLIWDVQPCGIHRPLVSPMNIHDEIITPTDPSVVDKVNRIKDEFIERRKAEVPLLGMGWGQLKNWDEKQ